MLSRRWPTAVSSLEAISAPRKRSPVRQVQEKCRTESMVVAHDFLRFFGHVDEVYIEDSADEGEGPRRPQVALDYFESSRLRGVVGRGAR